MSIVISGHEWSTMNDPLYIQGKQVTELWIKGPDGSPCQIYPDSVFDPNKLCWYKESVGNGLYRLHLTTIDDIPDGSRANYDYMMLDSVSTYSASGRRAAFILLKLTPNRWRWFGPNGYSSNSNGNHYYEEVVIDVDIPSTYNGYQLLLSGDDLFKAGYIMGASKLKRIYNTNKLHAPFLTMKGMFASCVALENTEDISILDVSHCRDFRDIFRGCMEDLDFSSLSNWNFGYDSPYWDSEHAITMQYMFAQMEPGNSRLSLPSNWNMSGVCEMSYMFYATSQANSFLDDLSFLRDWDVSNVTTFNHLFNNQLKLTSTRGLENWDTGKVTDFRYMFYGCNISNPSELSNWDTSSLVTAEYMFEGSTNDYFIGPAQLTTIDWFLGWDVSNCTSLWNIFGHPEISGDVLDMSRLDFSSVNMYSGLLGNFNFNEIRTPRNIKRSFEVFNLNYMNANNFEYLDENGNSTRLFHATTDSYTITKRNKN